MTDDTKIKLKLTETDYTAIGRGVCTLANIAALDDIEDKFVTSLILKLPLLSDDEGYLTRDSFDDLLCNLGGVGIRSRILSNKKKSRLQDIFVFIQDLKNRYFCGGDVIGESFEEYDVLAKQMSKMVSKRVDNLDRIKKELLKHISLKQIERDDEDSKGRILLYQLTTLSQDYKDHRICNIEAMDTILEIEALWLEYKIDEINHEIT